MNIGWVLRKVKDSFKFFKLIAKICALVKGFIYNFVLCLGFKFVK